MQRDDFLWVEKYRPHKISDCVLPSDLQEPLFARNNTKTPFYISTFIVVVNVILSITFFKQIDF